MLHRLEIVEEFPIPACPCGDLNAGRARDRRMLLLLLLLSEAIWPLSIERMHNSLGFVCKYAGKRDRLYYTRDVWDRRKFLTRTIYEIG